MRIDDETFFRQLADEMNARPDVFRVLGDADMVVALVMRRQGANFAVRITFEGLRCEGAEERRAHRESGRRAVRLVGVERLEVRARHCGLPSGRRPVGAHGVHGRVAEAPSAEPGHTGGRRRTSLKVRQDRCIGCGACDDCGVCVTKCPEHAIVVDERFPICNGHGCPMDSQRLAGTECSVWQRVCPTCGTTAWKAAGSDEWTCPKCDDGRKVSCPRTRLIALRVN